MEIQELIFVLREAWDEIEYVLNRFQSYKSFEKYLLPLRAIKADLERVISAAEAEGNNE